MPSMCEGYRFRREVISPCVAVSSFYASASGDELLMTARGIEVVCDTLHAWSTRFGPAHARCLRARAPNLVARGISTKCSSGFAGYGSMWGRAVNQRGDVPDIPNQNKRERRGRYQVHHGNCCRPPTW